MVVAINQLAFDPSSAFMPFSYGARRIEAALVSPPIEGAEVHFLELPTDDPDAIYARVEELDPDVIGCSTYVWSFAPFLEVARRLKARRPDRTIVFGGPSARPVMFTLAPFVGAQAYVDALVTAEGESPMRDIVHLVDRSADALARIPGVSVPDGGEWRATPPRDQSPMDDLPSPHQLGLIPGGLTAHLETFRGCPLSCSFCEWGVKSEANRFCSTEYLVRELQAFQRSNANGAFVVDAGLNLNQRAFRNLAEAEREVGFFRETEIAVELYASILKPEHIDFLKACKETRLGIGVQSFDKALLDRLQRPHNEEKLLRGVHMLAEAELTGAVELIMGLPTDTPAEFKRSVYRALALPMSSLHVFRCLALPDGLLTRAPAGSNIVVDPYSLRVLSCTGWSERDFAETSDWLQRLVEERGGWFSEGAFWSLRIAAESGPKKRVAVVDPVVEMLVRQTCMAASQGAWRVEEFYSDQRVLRVTLRENASLFMITLRPAADAPEGARLVGELALKCERLRGPLPTSSILVAAVPGLASAARVVFRAEGGASVHRRTLNVVGA